MARFQGNAKGSEVLWADTEIEVSKRRREKPDNVLPTKWRNERSGIAH